MFRIGAFSKASGLPTDTLYHYDRLGILKPARVDPQSGYRLYAAEQLLQVQRIIALKDAGLTLAEIGRLQNEGIETGALLRLLREKAQGLAREVAREQDRLARLEKNIFLIQNGGIPMAHEMTVKRVEAIRIASIRRSFDRAGFDENLEEMWDKVNKCIDQSGVRRTVPCLMLYHRGFWQLTGEDARLDVEVAEPLTESFEPDGEVRVYELPPVEKMACAVHHGSFGTIGKTFDKLFSWMGEQGYIAAGPLREIYHKGEWATDNPEEYITELQVPIG